MLALIERPPLLWPEYAIVYPKDFFELVDFHSPKYVRSLFSHNHESKTKTFLLGNSKSKRVTDLKTFKCKTSRFVQGILNRESEAVNIYFSPNEFYNWPRDKGLALFRANWLDIDITEKLDVPIVRSVEKRVIKEVLQQVEASLLPPPTGYVCSGSGGLHLYWIYDPVDANNVNKELWKKIANTLVEQLISKDGLWFVDKMASKRAYGNLRIPGSVHGRTGMQARYFGGGFKYKFDELINYLNLGKFYNELKLKQEEKRVIKLPFKPQAKRGNSKTPRRYGHNIKEWWLKCINTIQNHFYKQGSVPKGKRDKAAFILFVAFQHLNKNTAFEKLTKINDELIGLSKEELINLTKTAKTTHYKYKKETLADYMEDLLGLSPEYLNTKPKVKLSEAEIKERQKKAATETAVKKRSNSQQLVKKTVKKITKETGNKPTQQAVALLTNLSLRTVKRYWIA